MVIQGKYFLWTMKSNSLTENEEQYIPSHILKTIFGLHASVIFRPKYVWFPIHLKGPMIPDPSGQLAELIVYITSTRVDLYSHQILLRCNVTFECKNNASHDFDDSPLSCLWGSMLSWYKYLEGQCKHLWRGWYFHGPVPGSENNQNIIGDSFHTCWILEYII